MKRVKWMVAGVIVWLIGIYIFDWFWGIDATTRADRKVLQDLHDVVKQSGHQP